MDSNSKLLTPNSKLTLGFSPCPNDCFIFDAMIHHKIDTEGLEFDVLMGDVETLNQKAFKGELDITKLSFHAFAHLTSIYNLLNAGSAIGKGCGPLLVGRAELGERGWENDNSKIAIPGKYTTANFLLSLAFPDAKNKTEMVFSKIEDAVLNKEVDLGLIIHENRFTYEQKGLKKIIDLGEWWETQTQLPIPLGGIVVKKSISKEMQLKVDKILRKSVEYAFANPKSSLEFVKQHAQEMSEDVMYKHIDLYVNNYSIDLAEEGRNAIKRMFNIAKEKNIINKIKEDIFL